MTLLPLHCRLSLASVLWSDSHTICEHVWRALPLARSLTSVENPSLSDSDDEDPMPTPSEDSAPESTELSGSESCSDSTMGSGPNWSHCVTLGRFDIGSRLFGWSCLPIHGMGKTTVCAGFPLQVEQSCKEPPQLRGPVCHVTNGSRATDANHSPFKGCCMVRARCGTF